MWLIRDGCLFESTPSFLNFLFYELELKRDSDSLKPSAACETLPSCATLLLFDYTSLCVLNVIGVADYICLSKMKSK